MLTSDDKVHAFLTLLTPVFVLYAFHGCLADSFSQHMSYLGQKTSHDNKNSALANREHDLHIFAMQPCHSDSCIQATHSDAWPGTHSGGASISYASSPGSGTNCCFLSLGSPVVDVSIFLCQ